MKIPRLERNRVFPAACIAAAVMVVCVLPCAEASRLAFKDGKTIDVGAYQVQGNLVLITETTGNKYLVKTDTVDLERTKSINRVPEAVPTPILTPTRTPSLADVARLQRMKYQRTHPAPVGAQTTPEPVAAPKPTPPVTGQPVATATPALAAVPTPDVTPVNPAPMPTAAAAAPVRVPAPRGPEAPPVKERNLLAFALYGGFVVVALGLVAGVVMLLSRRKGHAKEAAWAEDLHAPEALFADEPAVSGDPVWGDDPAAEAAEPAGEFEEPELVESFEDQAAGFGQGAKPAAIEEPLPAFERADDSDRSVFGADAHDIEIKIGRDIFLCPDVPTLRQWISEGRVIENSEVKTHDGRWFMAGTLPELESSFAERRANLGF